MQEQSNMVTQQSATYKCKNRIFAESGLEETFGQDNWSLHTNEPDHIAFKSPTSDYDYFEIFVDSKKIYVTIPLKNSTYKYKTSFDSYFNACEYVEMQFHDFINNK
jgi:hypothetical protein